MEEEEILEISTSLAAGSMTLFLGTGFSKFMTNGKAPSWLRLLFECGVRLDEDHILDSLFVYEKDVVEECHVDLTVCAQILEEEYIKKDREIREEISTIIKENINLDTIDKNRVKQFREFLEKHPGINIVTTNYDSIITDFILPLGSKPVVNGKLIPKAMKVQPIFHIHGSILEPDSIVLTEGDYFNFLHRESYMSRKLFTLIQETTLIIMGYSLGDFNLNRILNEAKELKLNTVRKSDIYYIYRNNVEEVYKRYFYTTFGVSVLQKINIDEFFSKLDAEYETADKLISDIENLPLILDGSWSYSSRFLKLRQSFSHILLRADAFGYSIEDRELQDLILDVLQKKRKFTSQFHAWEQYEHLANWLVHLGALFEMKDTRLDDEFIKLVKYSFRYMSEALYKGYSWKSHTIWQSHFNLLKPQNRKLIIEKIDLDSFSPINAVEKVLP